MEQNWDLVQPGDHVEITEIQTNMNYSYIMEPAVAMSGCFGSPGTVEIQKCYCKRG